MNTILLISLGVIYLNFCSTFSNLRRPGTRDAAHSVTSVQRLFSWTYRCHHGFLMDDYVGPLLAAIPLDYSILG
ncbi:hypothetical protein BKA93DRAFT_763292 [Sparassis latifolia]